MPAHGTAQIVEFLETAKCAGHRDPSQEQGDFEPLARLFDDKERAKGPKLAFPQ